MECSRVCNRHQFQFFPTLVAILCGANYIHGGVAFFPHLISRRDTIEIVVVSDPVHVEISDLFHLVFARPISSPLPDSPARLLFANQWHLTWDGCGSDTLTTLLQSALETSELL